MLIKRFKVNLALGGVHPYTLLVWLAATILFLITLEAPTRDIAPAFSALGLLGISARHLRINLYQRGNISTHIVVLVAAGILLGPTSAMILGVMIGILRWPWKLPPIRYVFDAGVNALTAGAVATAATPLRGVIADGNALLLFPIGIVLGTMTFAINACLTTGVMTISEHGNFMAIWRERASWLLPHFLAFGVLAVGMARAGAMLGIAGLLLFAVPVLAMRVALRQYVEQTQENLLALREANTQLEEQNRELERAHAATRTAFAGMLKARDDETEGHSERVVVYALSIARELGIKGEALGALEVGALLHDIGKVGVSDAILHKPGPLTPEEWTEMRRHPEIGYHLTEQIPFLRPASPVVRHHHERWDGSGYPDGLHGDAIPLGARIFAVADTFDAMVSDRPYRKGLAPEIAFAEIGRGAGRQFDPDVVDAFLAITRRGEWPAVPAGAELVAHPPAGRILYRRRAQDWAPSPPEPPAATESIPGTAP